MGLAVQVSLSVVFAYLTSCVLQSVIIRCQAKAGMIQRLHVAQHLPKELSPGKETGVLPPLALPIALSSFHKALRLRVGAIAINMFFTHQVEP